MLKKATTVALLGTLAFPFTSYAEGNFNYNTMSIRVGTSPFSFGGEMTGNVSENSHYIVSADTDFSDRHDISGGLGFNGPITPFADITGQMLLHAYSSDAANEEKVRAEVNIGARVWIVQDMEAYGKLGQLISNDKSYMMGRIGMRFHSTGQLAIGLEFSDSHIMGRQIVFNTQFKY